MLSLEEKSTLINSAAGSAIGIASAFLPKQLAALLSISVMYLTWLIFRQQMKLDPATHGTKWWIGQGAYPFIVFWLFVWVLAYNFLV